MEVQTMPPYDGMTHEELVVAAQFLWMENVRLKEIGNELMGFCDKFCEKTRVDNSGDIVSYHDGCPLYQSDEKKCVLVPIRHAAKRHGVKTKENE